MFSRLRQQTSGVDSTTPATPDGRASRVELPRRIGRQSQVGTLLAQPGRPSVIPRPSFVLRVPSPRAKYCGRACSLLVDLLPQNGCTSTTSQVYPPTTLQYRKNMQILDDSILLDLNGEINVAVERWMACRHVHGSPSIYAEAVIFAHLITTTRTWL